MDFDNAVPAGVLRSGVRCFSSGTTKRIDSSTARLVSSGTTEELRGRHEAPRCLRPCSSGGLDAVLGGRNARKDPAGGPTQRLRRAVAGGPPAGRDATQIVRRQR